MAGLVITHSPTPIIALDLPTLADAKALVALVKMTEVKNMLRKATVGCWFARPPASS